jgi:hypothetical protein
MRTPSAKYLLVFLLAYMLSACQTLPEKQRYIPFGWLSKVDYLEPEELSTAENPLYLAVKEPGAGGLSDAIVLRTLENITIYRVWNGPEGAYRDDFKTTNRLGFWWSPEHPQGSKAAYRQQYGVCPQYNELEWVTSCTLHAGSLIAVGPTQSVNCKDGPELPATSSLQIYVQNYGRDVTCLNNYVKACGAPNKRDYKALPDELIAEDCRQ